MICPAVALALSPQDKLTQYGRQTWQTENGLPQNTVRAILQDYQGYLWLGTEGGLARFDGLKFTVFNAENTAALKNNNILSLLEDKAGTLWIGTAEGLASLHNTNFQSYTIEDGLPANRIWSLTLDRAGVLWATTPEGAASFHNNYFVRGVAPPQTQTVQDSLSRLSKNSGHSLPSSQITVLYPDREGSLWVGTNTGAARITNGIVERFPPNDPLSHDAILSIYEDHEGNMWFGSDSGGLTILRDQSFTTYTGREGALGN
jgi:ligand-binding sensor domain-containing protein